MTNERLQQLMANALDMATGVNEIIQEIEQAKKPILRRQASILRKELHEAVQTLQTIDLN
jgi:energy-converting hydrogenase A subunit M